MANISLHHEYNIICATTVNGESIDREHDKMINDCVSQRVVVVSSTLNTEILYVIKLNLNS